LPTRSSTGRKRLQTGVVGGLSGALISERRQHLVDFVHLFEGSEQAALQGLESFAAFLVNSGEAEEEGATSARHLATLDETVGNAKYLV
jgi:hypothetical protein